MSKTKEEVLKYSSKIKREIQEKTKNIEATVVSNLWRDPQLYLDYDDINQDKFKNSIWKLYFTIGYKMAMKSIKKIEETDVDLFLQGKDKLKETFDDFGGFEIIRDLQEVCNIENLESYLDEINKWNVIWNIVDKFTINDKSIEIIDSLDAEGVYEYYSAILNNTFTSSCNNYIASNLDDGLEEVISEANEGLNNGLPIDSQLLSSEIGGLMLGQTYLIGGTSGVGKTTFLLDVVMPSLIENDESGCFMLNEQDNKKIKQQMLTYFINNLIITNPNKYFSSSRWREGNFTEEEMDWLRQASQILKEKQRDNKIIIVELKTYNRKEVERLIKQYANAGINYFFLDTLKISDDSSNDNFWLGLMQDVLAYSNLVKPSNLNVHLTMTMQLQKVNKSQRYLDNSLIGMSKSMVDTASVVLLMRRFYADEVPGMKHEIKVKRKITGTESFDEVVLNPNEHHQLIFISKNRNGSSEEYQIVARQELGLLKYEERGIANIMPC